MSFPIVMAAIGAASSAMGIYGQNQAADAEAAAARAANEQQQIALREQQIQIGQAASEEARQKARETNRQLAKFMVASGASGLGGVSTARQESVIGIGEQIAQGIIRTNRQNQLNQSYRQSLSIAAQNQGIINQARASKSNPLSAVLGIAMGGGTGYMAGADLKKALAKPTTPGVIK